MLKPFFDLVFSIIILTIVFLPMIILVLLLLFNFGMPLIFKQDRPGKGGLVFKIYKLRTMTDKRDADGILLSDEQRLSRFGAILRSLSLDELPSLLNVLKGDMSLVGPRPLLVEYLPLYSTEQARRHEVKPGITGWAQVNGRNTISWEERFKLDVWYVDNQSFWLDIKILFLTVKKVFIREGISEEGQATMSKFEGNNNS